MGAGGRSGEGRGSGRGGPAGRGRGGSIESGGASGRRAHSGRAGDRPTERVGARTRAPGFSPFLSAPEPGAQVG